MLEARGLTKIVVQYFGHGKVKKVRAPKLGMFTHIDLYERLINSDLECHWQSGRSRSLITLITSVGGKYLLTRRVMDRAACK